MSIGKSYYIPATVALLLLCGAFGVVSLAQAQDNARPTLYEDRTDMHEEMEQHMEDAHEEADGSHDEASTTRAERQETREAMQEERRAEMEERVQVRVTHLMENMKAKMNAAIDRLRNIADRLESRVKKLEEQGVDGSEALAHIDTAREELDAAWDIINGDIYTNLYSAVSAANPSNNIRILRENVLNTHTHIRAAHQALREAVAALKTAVRAAGLDGGVRDAVRSDQSFDRPDKDHGDDATSSSTEETASSTEEND